MPTLHKTYPVAHFKALEDQGAGVFEAIVSVFNNVDLIGDRVLPGAFTKSLSAWKRSGDPIPVIFSHQWDNLDAHVGLVTQAEERPEGLYVKAQLDMDEQFAARLWKKMNQRAIKEFSFAYDVVKERRGKDGANDLLELNLIEVGPTLKGMNPATQLISVKKAIAAHSTATSDAAWDGPAVKAKIPNDAGASVFRRMFAWVDPEGDPEVKNSYKFIHHMYDTGPGAANLTACSSGIGVLNGGRGGTTIPDADREGVHAHLAQHLSDANQEPAPLKNADEVGFKTGRVLSAKNEQSLKQAHDLIHGVLAQLASDEEKSQGTDDEPAALVKSEETATKNPADLRLMAELLRDLR